jgi:hypothetical protein
MRAFVLSTIERLVKLQALPSWWWVVSLDMENGPYFTGDPKRSAPEQTMTAEVEVLRFTQQHTVTGAAPTPVLKVRFLGRDRPDFSFCSLALPDLPLGRVLLLPLSANPKASAPWQLIGPTGAGMTTQVTGEMGEPAPAGLDGHSFIVRELVNSFRRGDPLATFTAASLASRQANYLEPELTTQLQRSIGSDKARWAQVLANMILSYWIAAKPRRGPGRQSGTGLATIQWFPTRATRPQSCPWRDC